MKRILIFLLSLSFWVSAGSLPSPETIFSDPPFYGNIPSDICWSPADSAVAFIWNKNGYRYGDIWLACIPSGKLRQLTSFNLTNSTEPEKMIGNLTWFPKEQKLVFTYCGDIYLLSAALEQEPIALTTTAEIEYLPSVSPDEKYIAYLRDDFLYLFDIEHRLEFQLSQTICGNWQSEIITLNGQQKPVLPYYWSPTGGQIAIPDYIGDFCNEILLFNPAKPQDYVRYPIAEDEDVLIRNLLWSPDEEQWIIDYLSRDLRTRNIVRVLLKSHQIDTLYSRYSEWWCPDFGAKLFWVNQGTKILFGDVQSGYQHLFVTGLTAATPIALTRGKWHVFDYAVREQDEQVFFSANLKKPNEKQIYTIDAKTDKVLNVSYKRGSHDFVLSRSGAYLIDRFCTATIPSELYFTQTLPVSKAQLLLKPDARIPGSQSLNQSLTRKLLDPVTGRELYYTLWYPENHRKSDKFPLLIYLNEGKKPVSSLDEWKLSNLINQWISSQGYIVAEIDYPTLPLTPDYLSPADSLEPVEIQLETIESVLEVLTQESFIDASRIGIWGFGYGGYLSLMTILQSSARNILAAAILAETNWISYFSLYDNLLFKEIGARDYQVTPDNPDLTNNLCGKLLVSQGNTSPLQPLINIYDFTQKMTEELKRIDFIFYPWDGPAFEYDQTYIDILIKFRDFLKQNL